MQSFYDQKSSAYWPGTYEIEKTMRKSCQHIMAHLKGHAGTLVRENCGLEASVVSCWAHPIIIHQQLSSPLTNTAYITETSKGSTAQMF